VRELWFHRDSGWHHGNLTETTDAPLARGDLAGFAWHVDRAQHVMYRGRDNHIHELSFNQARGWKHADLTRKVDAPLAAQGVSGYTWDVDGTQHVVYRSGDGHVHELWSDGDSNWHLSHLTEATGAPLAASAPSGYTWDVDNTQHVVYQGQDGGVHELWYRRDTGWRYTDLSAIPGAATAESRPGGYSWYADEAQHVVYRGPGGGLHELRFSLDSRWQHHDLTAAAGAPPAQSRPLGYTWNVDGSQHIVYLGEDGNIHELWFQRWEVV
jgi:hypothetical protein